MGGEAAAPAPSGRDCQPAADANESSEIELDEVLLFLLGKTPSIQGADAISTASTNMRGPHSIAASSDRVCTDNIRATCTTNDKSAMRDSEPISETDSDDEVVDRPRTTADVVEPSDSVQDLGGKPSLNENQKRNVEDSFNQRWIGGKPDIQPEDEDASISHASGSLLRQRQPHPAESATPETPICQAPRRPPQPPSIASLARSISTHSDLLFVVLILCVLCGYCVAVIYRTFHPISYPLPNVDALFEPFDVSNVSARFSSPRNDESFTDGVMIEWEISHFPANALRKHGPEPFEYRVFLDDDQLLFDIGFWAIESEEETEINKTIRHRLRPRDIPSLGTHTLRLEVTFPIPGSDDELLTLSDTTTFTFTAIDSATPQLEILSPSDGALILDRSFVVEYKVHNVDRLDIIVDHALRMHKRHISDGNLLLRGLGAGWHSISLEAFDGNGTLVAAKETHLTVLHH